VKKRRLVFSDAAISDILEQADWYETQSGKRLAKRWEQAVTEAVAFATKRPLAGSACNFKSSELNSVRRVPINGFPKHLLFYRFDENEVHILRVVHGARDLERLF